MTYIHRTLSVAPFLYYVIVKRKKKTPVPLPCFHIPYTAPYLYTIRYLHTHHNFSYLSSCLCTPYSLHYPFACLHHPCLSTPYSLRHNLPLPLYTILPPLSSPLSPPPSPCISTHIFTMRYIFFCLLKLNDHTHDMNISPALHSVPCALYTPHTYTHTCMSILTIISSVIPTYKLSSQS